MSEYIERAAAIKCAEESYKMWNLTMAAAEGAREINKCYKWQDVCEAIGETFKIVPAADVAPVVHGRWNGWHGGKVIDEETQRKYHYYECSECRRRSAVKSRFCPNCGAKMDGGTRNDG